MVYLIDKQMPIDQAAKMFQTGQAVHIERALQVDQGGRSRLGRVVLIDKERLIDQGLLIDQELLIEQEWLIDKGGRSRLGRVFLIDKAELIDREISIGPVRYLVIKVPPE